MDDSLQVFEDALAEEGIDAEVKHFHDAASMSDVYQVTATVDGKRFGREVSISDRERAMIDDLDQHIAHLAERAARDLREQYTERIEWQDKCVEFDAQDSYTATCFRCGSSVSTEDLEDAISYTAMAESTVPNPRPVAEALTGHALRMALLGLLRDECAVLCPNSDRNI